MDTLVERRGISVGLYLCPYLEEVPLPSLRLGRRYLYDETQEDEYFVKRDPQTISKRKTMLMKIIRDKKNISRKDTTFITKAGFVMSNNSSHTCEGGGDGASATTTSASATMYNMFQQSKCGILDPTNPNVVVENDGVSLK